MKVAHQYLRIDGMEVEPDIVCPECGKPWKQGASYGHNYCCGCPTCGYSINVLELEILKIRQKGEIKMKVEKIAKSLEEYNRLQKLIDELKTAEDKLQNAKNEDSYVENGLFHCEVIFECGNYKNINLSGDATKLIKYDLITIFQDKVKELKSKQNALEVE